MREEVKTHNLRDRFGSRAYHLHIIGPYEGQLKPDELITELEKVEKYLDVIKGAYREGRKLRKVFKTIRKQPVVRNSPCK